LDKFIIVIIAIVLYCLFSVNLDLGIHDYSLFRNDFSREGVLNWLTFELIASISPFLVGLMGANYISNKFIKRVFIAIQIDAVITFLRYLIFGYDEPIFAPMISNILPLSYIIYSYIVYGRFN